MLVCTRLPSIRVDGAIGGIQEIVLAHHADLADDDRVLPAFHDIAIGAIGVKSARRGGGTTDIPDRERGFHLACFARSWQSATCG
jgi:hypothetical protein